MSPHSPGTAAALPVRIILIKLRPGVDRHEYEEFLRRADYPVAATRQSVPYYRNHRIRPETKVPGDTEWDYVEYIQATSVEEYDEERARNPNTEFQRINPRYVERTVSFWADAVEPATEG